MESPVNTSCSPSSPWKTKASSLDETKNAEIKRKVRKMANNLLLRIYLDLEQNEWSWPPNQDSHEEPWSLSCWKSLVRITPNGVVLCRTKPSMAQVSKPSPVKHTTCRCKKKMMYVKPTCVIPAWTGCHRRSRVQFVRSGIRIRLRITSWGSCCGSILISFLWV